MRYLLMFINLIALISISVPLPNKRRAETMAEQEVRTIMERLSADPNVRIQNPEKVFKKLEKIINDGFDDLLVSF